MFFQKTFAYLLRAANYHSRTPQYNQVYRAHLIRKASKWADWLDARFVTFDMNRASATHSPEYSTQIVRPGVEPQQRKTTASQEKNSPLQVAKAEYVPRMIIAKRQSEEKR